MRRTRLFLMIALLALALFGVYWAVSAQEGNPLFAPPAVLPAESADKKPAARFPHATQPLKGKPKGDATLIVPAEVYDVPRPIGPQTEARGFATEEASGIVQAQGVATPPLFPPLPAPKVDKGPSVLPPLPTVDINPPAAPMIDPIRALVIEPTTKEQPAKKAAGELPAPLVISDPKPAPPTVVLPSVVPLEPVQTEKPRAFVRIKPDLHLAPVITDPHGSTRPLDYQAPDPIDLNRKLVLPQPALGLSGLVNLQTPTVTIEKRGVGRLRRDQSESYQIVIRNLGPGNADQVRIEDDLPADVKVVSADPLPALQGNKAVWLLSNVGANQEQTLRLTLQASADTEISGRISAHVSAVSPLTTTALRPRLDAVPMAIQLVGPSQVAVGKPALFEIRVSNQASQPLTGIVLHGSLSDGLTSPAGNKIEGEVDATIAPGETKTLKMPAEALKPGRWIVAVKVTAQGGQEASATANIEVAAETLHLQQPTSTRLYMGRDGDLRIDVTNHTSKPLRNVTVADRLPDGLDFVDANARGLYQANSRIVYWVIDQLPAGKMQTLVVRVNGVKAGQHENVVCAKADGIAEMQSSGVVALEGLSDLTLRVIERDNLLELGKETEYEIKVQNSGNVPAGNVQLQVQFPPGLLPKNAQGKTRFTLDRQSVVFEPIGTLDPQGELIFRVTALAQSVGDQRMRFAVASEQVRVPIEREVSTRVYADKNP